MTANITLADLIKLYQCARVRFSSGQDYFDFQCYQGSLLVRYLQAHQVELANRQVLDLGSGIGGYAKVIQDAGASVLAVDQFTRPFDPSVFGISADALRLPLGDRTLDLVICASLIEHVADPTALIAESFRVLRNRGFLYLSFPPYYSPIGGHQFAPYHLFGQRFAIKMAARRGVLKKNLDAPQDATHNTLLAKAFGDWGLYPLTISKVSGILKQFPLVRIDRSTRWIPMDFSGIPYLGEFLTWHVQFLLQKS